MARENQLIKSYHWLPFHQIAATQEMGYHLIQGVLFIRHVVFVRPPRTPPPPAPFSTDILTIATISCHTVDAQA